MKHAFHFIHFVETPIREVRTYTCKNNRSGDELGGIVYHRPWHQWCFVPSGDAIFSADCLADVQTFLSQLATEGTTP